MRTDRINFLDLHFDRLSFKDVEERLSAATGETPYAYVVTPNVDHMVRVHQEPELRGLYEAADICVCDSRILKLLASLSGIKLPLVPGSDLSAALFLEIIRPGDRIAIVGADRRCIAQLQVKFPNIEFLHFEPPMGLRANYQAQAAAAAFVNSSKARFAFIAVGSPQQEMIAKQVRDHPGATGVALCIGAGLDFIVGKQKRAPRIIQTLGLEWAHRLATNPRRLWRRYLVEDVRIVPIWIQWRRPAGRMLPSVTVAGCLVALTIGIYALSSSKPQRSATTSETLPAAARSVSAIKGLPPPDLLKPVSPEEATKENADRPFVGRPDSPASPFALRTDAVDRDRAITCLAQAVYYEAAGEGVDGQRAVAQIVLNRVHHPGFPSTICGVVYQGADRITGCQFSFVCNGSMQRTPVPWLWTRSRQIAEQALAGKVFAPVGHATHYHADYVLPYWADSLDKSVQVGHHIFYRLRSIFGESRAFSQHYGGAEPQVRVPGAAVVIPPAAVTPQLASALISDSSKGLTREVEKVAIQPSSPLLVDSTGGTLLADSGVSQKVRKQKSSGECPVSADHRQLAPMGANDMRASSVDDGC